MSEESGQGGSATSTGLDPKLGGMLCYLLMWITGIVFLLAEREDKTIRFHAYQSLVTFLGLHILIWIAPVLPGIGRLASVALILITLVLWVLLLIRTYQGDKLKLPYIGDWAEEQAGSR